MFKIVIKVRFKKSSRYYALIKFMVPEKLISIPHRSSLEIVREKGALKAKKMVGYANPTLINNK